MKFLNMIAIIALFSISAVAGEKSTSNNPNYLLRYTLHPGYSHQPVKTTTTVYINGIVLHESHAFQENVIKTTRVAKLSPPSVANLMAAIKRINATDLVDLDDGGPICMDESTPVFEVKKGTEEAIVISTHKECHRFEMPNSAEARKLKNLLMALSELSP
ncbi:MAG: hypothetical protein SGI74_11755 [Oligoflexia bacterium]|nr:hypothetical protein [Oligoflexia bacterium]